MMRTLDRISPFWRFALSMLAVVAALMAGMLHGISTYEPEPMSTHFKTAMETPHDPR